MQYIEDEREGESSNRYHDFVPTKGLFRRLLTQFVFKMIGLITSVVYILNLKDEKIKW